MFLQKKAPRIVASGLKTRLRKFERADLDQWVAWPRHEDPLFESYNPPSLNPRQRDHYYKTRAGDPTVLQFAVEDEAQQVIGRVSLRHIDWVARSAVLGLTFHPHRLGQGYGTDSLEAFLGHYFTGMGMSLLLLDVAAFNVRAYRCYLKCGFRVCSQHYGESQPDYARVMHRPEYTGIRHLFKQQDGFIRPLLFDMVLRRNEFHDRSGDERHGTVP